MDADNNCVIADVRMPVQAKVAAVTDQMGIRIYNIAHIHSRYTLPHLYNLSGIFMPDNRRRIHAFLRIIVPMPDMYIRATDCNSFHTYQHIIIANLRHRLLCQRNKSIALLLLHNAFHHFHPVPSLFQK